jgi:hypothetical protein
VALGVLITNIALVGRSGTEVVTYDLACALQRLGHRVTVYSPHCGSMAEALRDAGIAVAARIEALDQAPDIIHGQHNTPTLTALARFPDVPALFVCHDSTAWHDAPPLLARIRRYGAVDEVCEARLLAQGIAPARIVRLANAVDLARFRPRAALPERPQRALVLTKNSGHLDAVRAACAEAGLALDALGPGAGRVVADLEAVLPGYDLVFATARMAIESLAVGTAVIVCDERGFAGMVTADNVERWRRANFGKALLTDAVTRERLRTHIARYDARDAAAAAAFVRRDADLADSVRRVVALYDAVIAEHRADPAPAPDESRALAALLEALLPSYRTDWPWQQERAALQRALDDLEGRVRITRRLARLRRRLLRRVAGGRWRRLLLRPRHHR